MPATIELLPRKEFKIILEDNTQITGKFGTWALKRFCTKKNYTLAQLGAALGEKLSIDDMVEFILCAVEQAFREAKTGTSFPYNDVDACTWIDELGGFASAGINKLFSHSGDAIEEKKSDQEDQSSGQS